MKSRLLVAAIAAGLFASLPVLAQPAGQRPAGDRPAQPGGGGGRQPGDQPGEPGGGRGQPRGPREGGGPGGGGRGPGQNVGGAMRTLREGLDQLKENIGAADKKDQNLAVISQMQRATVNAKNARPADLKGADQPKTFETYRRAQIKLLSTLLELETQVLDGKTDEAKATIKKLEEMRDKAHEQFVKDEHGNEKPAAPAAPAAPAEKK